MEEQRGTDEVTVVTTTSWIERLWQSAIGILVGFAFVVGAVVLLFWNEGRAIHTAQGLAEGAGIVRSVSADTVDPGNEGRLVHVSGPLATGAPVVDPDFALRVRAVRLFRDVEMYQWKEETHTETHNRLGGSEERRTTYRYVRGWSDKPIDSDRFRDPSGHTNPAMPYQSREIVASTTHLGAFAVPASLLHGFGERRPFAATEDQANALQIRIDKRVRVMDGKLYAGRDPAQPAIGDLRVSFFEVPQQVASIVAAQQGASFGPFATRAGTNVELIAAGAVPAAAMFQHAEEENVTLTWVLRFVGVVLMAVGFGLVLRPLKVLADVIPLAGIIVGAGAGLVALACTAALAPLAIAVGWLWYRPLVGIALLVAGGAVAYGLGKIARRRAAKRQPA